jgi:site-specific DNA-adenine methylase
MAVTATPRPFLKWAGGKTQLTDALMARMPPAFGTYHEPFLGSGALFFRLYREGKLRHAVLSDINPELIDTYLAIRDQPAAVIQLLAEFPYEESFYYQLRARDPWAAEPGRARGAHDLPQQDRLQRVVSRQPPGPVQRAVRALQVAALLLTPRTCWPSRAPFKG